MTDFKRGDIVKFHKWQMGVVLEADLLMDDCWDKALHARVFTPCGEDLMVRQAELSLEGSRGPLGGGDAFTKLAELWVEAVLSGELVTKECRCADEAEQD